MSNVDKLWKGRCLIQVFIVFIVSIVQIHGAPINRQNSAFTVPPAYALTFMRNFGYLPPGMPGAEAQYSQESMAESLKTAQKFGNIPQTGVFDNATLELFRSPRCGIPDVKWPRESRSKRYIIGSTGWNKRDITYFIANWTPKLGEEVVVNETERAFAVWSGYSRLNFRRTDDTNADIIVAFGSGEHGDGYAFDGRGQILAHAFYPYEMNSYGGDLHFDDDEDWITRNGLLQEGTDFYSVAVHEIGHSLGLAHSISPSSVMYPYYRGSTPDLQLDYDDILGLYELYISRPLEGDYPTETQFDTSSTERAVATTTISEEEVPETTETSTTETTTTDHLNRHSTGSDNGPSSTVSTIPDICEGSFDAISVFRTELFVFKGEYLWRLSRRGSIQDGYPVKFRQLFWQLPENVTKIDAAYQRDTDASIVLFSGKQYWVYDGYSFIEGSPRPLTDYGIDEAVEGIDAVQVWGKNNKLYLYKGAKFWRFNETSHTLDPGYPHSMRRWRGVPSNIDAAMTWIDGKTYFFKDNLVWKFDNFLIITDDHYPVPAAQYWLGCPEKPDTILW